MGDVAEMIAKYIGEDGKALLNEAGDLILQSADEMRAIRIGFNRTHPHASPHVHVIEYKKVKNKKVEVDNQRVYPNDVPKH